MTKIYFEGIQHIIVEKIRKAQHKISIAVAWFTNEEIFCELIELLDKNVEISLVIFDDYINNGPFGLNFSMFIEKGGKLFYSTIENPVHHKFCIIDESCVFSGSYNWTYYAEYKNYENELLLIGKNYVDSYVTEFNKITQILDQRKQAIKYSELHSSRVDTFSQKEYLANDILIRGIKSNRLELIQQAKAINSINTAFVKMASLKEKELKTVISKTIKPIVAPRPTTYRENKPIVTKLAYGISSRKDDIDDRFAIILKKGETVPIIQDSIFYTVDDDQTQIDVEIYKGENPQASKNSLIGKILINDLPSLPAGNASIKVTFAIDIKGTLNVKVVSIQTGNSLESNYYNSL